ncbi:MAG TPA: hypothetical protein VNI82_00570 [Candidatus Nitrosotenuis sp.]|nr:hypothetical protein [Candidatus Nitrosotenuis sp.]
MAAEYIRDDRATSFFQIGDLTRMIAEKHCQVPIDELTVQRWRELLGLLREFDTLVDDTHIGTKEALAQLEDFDFFRHTYPHLSPEQLPKADRSRMLGRTALVLGIGEQLTAERNLDNFIAIRIREGVVTADMLGDSATPETRVDPRFYTSFLPIMRSLSVTACLLDSLTDGKQDYREGKISIKPDRAFYSGVARAAFAHSKRSIPALMHLPILHQFGVMSATRLRNRLKYGVTPYSSIKNI